MVPKFAWYFFFLSGFVTFWLSTTRLEAIMVYCSKKKYLIQSNISILHYMYFSSIMTWSFGYPMHMNPMASHYINVYCRHIVVSIVTAYVA